MKGFQWKDRSGFVKEEEIKLCIHKNYKAPDIKDIENRSKRDPLSKGLVILQTAWFILQFLGRVRQGLHITELEVATLGYAILSIVTLMLWWKKPYNVACPILVSTKWKRTISPQTDTNEKNQGAPDVDRATQDGGDAETPLPATGSNASKSKVAVQVPEVSYQSQPSGTVEARPAPHLTSGLKERRHRQEIFLFKALFAVIAILFGAIHCIAWSFHFPSTAERLIWRVSSLAAIGAPTVVLVLIIPPLLSPIRDSDQRPGFLSTSFKVIVYLSIIVYATSRLILLVVALTSLRSLPYTAYKIVQWTTYIPHL